MALKTDLKAYWKLDEASGNALDAHGSNTLTETSGTIASTTGKRGNARDFEATGDTEYFEIADNADLSAGDVDFSFACWVKPESTSGFPVIAQKGWLATGTVNSEWVIYLNSGSVVFSVRSGLTAALVTATAFGALSAGNWYHVVVWHDSVNNQIGVSVNGTANTLSHSIGVNNGTLSFQLGASSTQALYWDGLIDEAGFWKRVLTSTERSYLYNGGNGLAYGFEPANTVAPTLSISTTGWTGTVGTWDSQSNGTLTYAWELRDADDDSVVQSGTGSSPSGSGSYSGDYYLWVRASNDAGYDAAEDSVSADQAASGGVTNHSVTPDSIATGAPAIGQTSISQDHSLTTVAIATGAPAIGQSTLTQSHSLSPNGIATNAPAIGQSSLAQVHAVSPSGIATGSPVVGQATASSGTVYSVTPNAIATGAPAIGTSTLSQVHLITTNSIATGSPVVGSTTLAQVHSLAPSSIVSGTPTVGMATLSFDVVVEGQYLGQVVCYSQTVVCNRTTVRAY